MTIMAGREAYTSQRWFYLPNAFLLSHFNILYFIDLLLVRQGFYLVAGIFFKILHLTFYNFYNYIERTSTAK